MSGLQIVPLHLMGERRDRLVNSAPTDESVMRWDWFNVVIGYFLFIYGFYFSLYLPAIETSNFIDNGHLMNGALPQRTV